MKLLYKELALAAHPTLFIFTLLGCLVIVPSYPYSVIFMFGCLAPYITFMFARENNDTWYTAILPVKKIDAVKGKFLLILSVQLCQLIISIPFNVLRHALDIPNNPVGMDPTISWYGMGLIIFGVFNLIFFPEFYKTGYKAGKAFILAMIPVVVLMLCTEVIVHIPGFAFLDSFEFFSKQLPVFIFGLVLYVLLSAFSFHLACKRFTKVDL